MPHQLCSISRVNGQPFSSFFTIHCCYPSTQTRCIVKRQAWLLKQPHNNIQYLMCYMLKKLHVILHRNSFPFWKLITKNRFNSLYEKLCTVETAATDASINLMEKCSTRSRTNMPMDKKISSPNPFFTTHRRSTVQIWENLNFSNLTDLIPGVHSHLSLLLCRFARFLWRLDETNYSFQLLLFREAKVIKCWSRNSEQIIFDVFFYHSKVELSTFHMTKSKKNMNEHFFLTRKTSIVHKIFMTSVAEVTQARPTRMDILIDG